MPSARAQRTLGRCSVNARNDGILAPLTEMFEEKEEKKEC